MYYPYFRGKQFERKAIIEEVELLAENNIIPIIEPVKSHQSLKQVLEAISNADGKIVVIANPELDQLYARQ